MLYGAIIGDIVGSRFEFAPHKSKDFVLFSEDDRFTDDTVMSVAVAKALSEARKSAYSDLDEQLKRWLREIGRRYPDAGYGGRFYYWLMADEDGPYNSFGNGSAMRTSACGWYGETLDEVLQLASKCAAVSHDHPEGIKGAQAVSAAIFLARNGKSREEIREYISDEFYDLDLSVAEIRKTYRFDVTCQCSVPQAIECFLESVSYEDCIRNAVSLGGDSDTQAAIAGSIAEAFYGLDQDLISKADEYLDDYLKDLIRECSL